MSAASTQHTSRGACLVLALVLITLAPQSAAASFIFGGWNTTDASIFGAGYIAATRAANGDTVMPSGSYAGMRSPVSGSSAISGIASDPLSASSAFRLGVMSELFLSLAIGYLEVQGLLPFSRTSPIPVSYLPSALQSLLTTNSSSSTYLFNPNYGASSSFISLNMLMQHTSSLTEVGFVEFGIMQGPLNTSDNVSLPTRGEFLDDLFTGVGATAFSSSCQPSSAVNVWDQGGCLNYSRTNTALAGYVVEAILSTQVLPITNLESFVYTNIWAPMQLSDSFFLNKYGRMPLPSYPPDLSDAVADQQYSGVTVMSVNYSWSGPVQHFAIAADPFSDVMIYTTMSDLQRLASNVLLPTGPLYTSFGVGQLRSNMVQLTKAGTTLEASAVNGVLRNAGVNGAIGRSLGFDIFNLSALCDSIGEQLIDGCNASLLNVTSLTDTYGLGATTAFNQVAVLCATNSYSGLQVCAAAAVFYTDSSAFMPIRFAMNAAVALAYVVLQSYLLNTYSPNRGKSAVKLVGLWIFIGVLATIVVTVVLSYLTDYFVQPLPPAKVIAPVPGARGLAVETGWGGVAAASTTGPANALSPLPAVNLFADTDDENSVTPPRQGTSFTNPTVGSAASDRRSGGGGARRQGRSVQLSIDSSSTADGSSTGPRRRHRADDSSHGSSSTGPRSVARFDAYI